VTAEPGPSAAFDEQAARYDERAALPPPVGAAVAKAIVERAGANADDLIVELGAGTGEIGAHLARLPVRYVGLDNSVAMLDVFRAKAPEAAASLRLTDCNLVWPLSDGSTAAVFASRVIHLLEPAHVAVETRRVCRAAGLLFLGRVTRDPTGIRQRLRRRRRELLAAAGIPHRDAEEGSRRVIKESLARGGTSLGRAAVAEWPFTTTPAEVIAGWEGLARWGSVAVDAATRAAIVDELRAWAERHHGDLDRPETTPARYTVDIIRMP
jgi:SAM-dependent methyltransferase